MNTNRAARSQKSERQLPAASERYAAADLPASGEPFVGRPTWLGVSIAFLLVIVGVLMSVYLVLAA